MRTAPLGLLLGLLAAACGDNDTQAPDDETARCDVPAAALPTVGPLLDPLAMPLLDCVPGGLATLPGRWFVAADGAGFSFDYPRFEGSCEAGFQRTRDRPEDHDEADGSYFTWSDGTRIFTRAYFRFEIPNQPAFELVSAFAACMRADDTLSAARVSFNTDLGERRVDMEGKRFAPRDGAPVGLTLLGELGMQHGMPMPTYNLAVDGTRAYTVGPFGLDIIDVANPAAPVHLGHVEGAWNDVRVVRGQGKTIAYAAPLAEEVTSIIDVTNPATAAVVAVIPEYSHSLQVQQRGNATFLYLANYTNAVPRFDVTMPLVPVRLGQAAIEGPEAGVHDLTVDGDRLYINYTTEGFVALDVSGGLASPIELGRRASSYSHASWAGTVGGRQVVLAGDEGMTNSGGAFLSVLDADKDSPTFLKEIGRYQSRKETGIHNFELHGDKAYIAYYHDGVRIVDLSDPAMPREVGHYNTWQEETAPGGPFESALGIRVVGNKVYVADSLRGLMILQE